MDIRSITNKNRQEVNNFIVQHWFTTDMVVRGQIFDMTVLDGLVMYENENIIGLITCRFENSECEIMSLDSLKENCGIGTELVKEVVKIASEKKCTKIKLVTTNDNLNAMRFYQKRGFDMTHLYYNALEASRKIKPSIPQKGDYGIPIKHEIEFEMKLNL
ncbi:MULTISPECIES: GNAT family N-acetyltransferase [Clostridium]|uniref:GNAT family N-acetyltransferase n=1 Tax=Clostridium TaxID=1485 RepID=UPI000826A256|nr:MULTISPECIES: GNAT family N-acetyltransferase [Clostridium]PJI09541.1 N-acetyltransferase [Clostridium sp. CT7]